MHLAGRILKSNPTVLILDGLDEVPEKTLRKKVLDNISSFVAQVRNVLKGNLRVIATTRPSGYSEEFDPSHYLHLSLQKLSNEKAIIYANRWAEAREPNPQEKERIQTTFHMCLKDKVVSVLTQTPLQVTILLVIIRARGTPPKQREELFERYMDVIYQREQKKRPELLRTEADMIYSLHKYLAYILHRRAETDRTAALMEVSEFRDNVQKYLMHSNPLLNEDEVKDKTSQIMTEASQRLVLIESPQEGKIGFGLTTTREFFAAAHLVDTAKDTKERDLRFKAITRRPYWRNVALFFAGRVGRTRPGETASMVDVCREIDTERVDKFLKRGAELVMEMVDDRVLREPHNEIGAIQYELTIFDAEYIKALRDSIDKLTALSDPYKERVVHPWLEERLRSSQIENISVYVEIYRTIFGVNELLIGVIKKVGKSNLESAKLWALSEAIRDKIVEQWVIDLLETVVKNVSMNEVSQAISSHVVNIKLFYSFSMSPKAMAAIANALMVKIRYEPYSVASEILNELSELEDSAEYKEISTILSGVSKICKWSRYDLGPISPTENYEVRAFPPKISSPRLRQNITENAMLVKYCCNTLSSVDEPSIKFIIALSEFLLEPESFEKYRLVSDYRRKKEPVNTASWMASILIGSTPQDETEDHHYHKDLCTLFRLCKSEKQLNVVVSELNQIVNAQAKEKSSHPHRLRMWLESGCDPVIEKWLDRKILDEVNGWLKTKGFSKNVGYLWNFSFVFEGDWQLFEMGLKRIKKQLEEGCYRQVDDMAFYYQWQKPLTKEEAKIAVELKAIFEMALSNYHRREGSEYIEIEMLYWIALSAGIIEEKHMVELYQFVRKNSHFGSMPWHVQKNVVEDELINFIQNGNPRIEALAAVSLVGTQEVSRLQTGQAHIERDWIGEKFYELAKETDNIWSKRLIAGMRFCNLRWSKKGREWMEAIAEANTEELRYTWCQVIEEAGYSELVDRDALFNFILDILESENKFEKSVRVSALRRLHRLAIEAESTKFDEEKLNLPLGRRGS